MLQIYGSSMSPFVRKVLVVCNEKGVAFEPIAVGIGSTDVGFRAASPFGKMPAMVDGDYRLSDSSAIIHYLEAKHPEPRLIAIEAEARGRTIWFEEFADTILFGCAVKMFFNRVVAPMFLQKDGDLDAADRAEREELPPLLDYLEQEVGAAEYLVGGRLSVADIAVSSVLANLEYAACPVDPDRYPRLAAFMDRMFVRPSYASILDRERAFFAKARP